MSTPSLTLITGASGFVGRWTSAAFAVRGLPVVATGRSAPALLPGVLRGMTLSPAHDDEHVRTCLRGVRTVVHLAARVHDVHGHTSDEEFDAVNCRWPQRIAELAAQEGATRFIFMSSIKVNGDVTVPGRPFTEASDTRPLGGYAVSKARAELGLAELAERTGMDVAVVRPPLVYGPGVGANFLSLMRLVKRGVPLPFRAIHNARSFIYVENLADLVVRLASAPTQPRHTEVYLASDGEDVSTPELIRRMAAAMDRVPRLVPSPGLRTMLRLAGKGGLVQRLWESLQVDSSKARAALQWTPAISLDEGLRRTAQAMAGS
ncbi:MAG: NAD-dependent epimerase/dehydratase family protein [Kofleriaceae bacterium]|nr:NAD-dependent epimerase/dehydratase family protein [Kofleriaceae bacterium]